MAAIGRFLLIATAVTAPWVFGCVQPWPQFAVAAVVACLTVMSLLESAWGRLDRPIHLPAASVAPLVILLIGAIQLLPRDETPAARMAHAVHSEDAALYDGPEFVATGTLSASSTRRETARLYFAIAAFLLASQWFADPRTHGWLFGALAANGAALGAFGIVQSLSWNGNLFWTYELRYGGTPFASFVNRNNAAGYLNLCLAAAVGLVILVWSRQDASRHRFSRLGDRLRLFISEMDGVKLATLSLLIITFTSVLFSLSRGGIVAMVVAACVMLLFSFRGPARIAILALPGLVVVIAAGLLTFAGRFEAVDARVGTLYNPLEAASGRLVHWHDTLGAVKDFPGLGTGLGTYRYANLPYQLHAAHAWYYNADNEWFELLVEVGVLGCAAAIAGFVLLVISAVSLLRRSDSGSRASGAVGLMMVITQGLQALTDFGLIIPANALTFAVLAGTVCGTACQAAQFDRIRVPIRLSLTQLEGRPGQALFGMVLTIASFAFLLELFTASSADAARDHGVVVDRDRTPVESVRAAGDRMEQVLTLRPDDADLLHELGVLRAEQARLEMYQELVSEQPESTPAERTLIWNATSALMLSIRARELEANGQVEELNRLRNHPAVGESLAQARTHFQESMRHCVLGRGTATWLARLAFLDPEQPPNVNARYLHQARFTAPSTPATLLEIAELAEAGGEQQLADECWRRCLEVAPEQSVQVWENALQHRSAKQVIEQILPQQLAVLVAIAEIAESAQWRQELLLRAEEAAQEEKSTTNHVDRARLAELQSNPDEAIQHYRLALAESPWDSETRLRLADLLKRQGRKSEALDEYSLLRQLLPNRKDIQNEWNALRLEEMRSSANSRRTSDSDSNP